MAPWIKHSISSPVTSFDPADLRKAQLSGGNYTTGPLFLQKSCPILPCNGHLSASMEFHPGKMFSEICKHSHVLDNHPIQSGPVIGQYIFIQSGKFRFFLPVCLPSDILFAEKDEHTGCRQPVLLPKNFPHKLWPRNGCHPDI